MVNKSQLAAGVALGVLATLAAGKLFNQEPQQQAPMLQQPDFRMLQARLYGMTPEQHDEYNHAARTGYLPQHENAVLAAFMSLPRPARAEILNRMAQRGAPYGY